MHPQPRTWPMAIYLMSGMVLSGCVLAPPEAKLEKNKAQEAGQVYQQPFEKRSLPKLSAEPTWQEVLHRAFLANGELEGAYFEWRAALERIDQAAAYPNSNVQIGFDYMFSSEQMKSWNRTTVSGGFDPSMTLRLPWKVAQAGKVATEGARAAGLRFEAAKFDLQKRVLTAYFDYALVAEKIRIQQDNVLLLKMIANLAATRTQAGAPQQDLLKSQIEFRMAENELATMQAELGKMRAMLNGMLALPATTPLLPPHALPAPRRVATDDAGLIAAAVARNPELAALARDVAGRQEALALAKLAWLPDLQPTASLTGSISQTAGAMVMLPTAIPLIEGQIKENQAMLQGLEAVARQTHTERAASFVAALYLMRNAERQADLFQQTLAPVAQQAINSSREAYAAGQIGFVELADSRRVVLQIRLVIAESRMEREKQLAAMEALAGVDIETLGLPPATTPATNAASQPTTQPPTLP